jgi:hypothetical protein
MFCTNTVMCAFIVATVMYNVHTLNHRSVGFQLRWALGQLLNYVLLPGWVLPGCCSHPL